MEIMNAKETLNHLYGLMMDINFHRSDEEVWEELEKRPSARIEKHIAKIKQISAKLRAEATRQKYNMALEQIRQFKERGLDDLKKLLGPQEQLQLQPLFRKFEELTAEDEAAILEDQELLQLMALLKDKLDNNE